MTRLLTANIKRVGEFVNSCYHIPMRQLLVILFAGIFLSGCTVKNLFLKKPAGLEITTTPASTVFLNGENRGDTPFKLDSLKAGTYTLKLTPNSSSNLLSYETSLTLEPGVSTVINRTLGATEPDSFGYTLTFQEDVGGQTYLSVISEPDAVNINLDGTPHGFTPLSKISLNPGNHTLRLVSPGFVEQTLPVNTLKGFNLIVSVQLAGETINLTPSPLATASASPSLTPSASPQALLSPLPTSSSSLIAAPYVTVSDSPDITAAGGLNVRSEPSASSDPLGKAKVGERLKYLNETTVSGWFKVEFEGNPGYVSGKYVTLTK